METLQEIEARLTAPGAPFETVVETVLGERLRVFKQRPRSLPELLRSSAAHGDAEYLVCDGVRLSFAQHLACVASTAEALRLRFGIGPGMRVAILAANQPAWIVSWWAALALGAVPVALNGWWAADEILLALEDCQPSVLILDAKRRARLADRAPGVPMLEIEAEFPALWEREAELPEVAVEEDDPATILYTSGTTGAPKGAVNTHRGILTFVRTSLFHGVRMMLQASAQGQQPDANALPPCMLVNAPLFHVSGLYTGAVIPLATGVKTVWTRQRFEPDSVLEMIERERVTNWGPMGNMLHRLAASPNLDRFDRSSVRSIGSGGAPVSEKLLQLMRDLFPNTRASLGVGYGLTESTSGVTVCFAEELAGHPGSVGRPLPTVELEIRNAAGQPVGDGVEGEIHLRGPQIMLEYWRRPDATREVLLERRWLRTGDWGCLVDGFLYVNSRRRDLILRGAENIHPVEIEQCLEAHPAVAEAAVIGVEHAELGQEVKAIVVPTPGARVEAEQLRSHVAERLAYFKVPVHWDIRREALPRNAAGKVLKNLLGSGAANPLLAD